MKKFALTSAFIAISCVGYRGARLCLSVVKSQFTARIYQAVPGALEACLCFNELNFLRGSSGEGTDASQCKAISDMFFASATYTQNASAKPGADLSEGAGAWSSGVYPQGVSGLPQPGGSEGCPQPGLCSQQNMNDVLNDAFLKIVSSAQEQNPNAATKSESKGEDAQHPSSESLGPIFSKKVAMTRPTLLKGKPSASSAVIATRSVDIAGYGVVMGSSYRNASRTSGNSVPPQRQTNNSAHVQSCELRSRNRSDNPGMLAEAIEGIKRSSDCRQLTRHFELKYGIPQGLLLAIANVESTMSPWAVNNYYNSRYFSSLDDAVMYIDQLEKQRQLSISVGYMQINWMAHKSEFKSIREALTPYKNIEFAAKLLHSLYERFHSWDLAIMWYNPKGNKPNHEYLEKVRKHQSYFSV
ncbi:MAG: transglycosylase SLT domain-containing protein [Holosporales bacterium]|jgi:hypothetical protein|nr:transglycosylase SLT domain-containing protein [Holosporales bacterium]